MRINKLRVQHFHGAIDCDVDLTRTRNVAVFAGSNGSGKTSVIEACRLALGQAYGIRPVQPGKHFIEVSFQGDDGKEYAVQHTEAGVRLLDAKGQNIPLPNEALVSRLGLNTNWFFTSWRDPHLTNGVQLQTDNQEQVVPGKTREETLVWIKETLVRWDVMAQFNKDAKQIAQIAGVFDRMRAAWSLFFPNSSSSFVSRSVSSVMQDNGFVNDARKSSFLFDLYLKRDRDGLLISLNDLSSGELEVFCFLGVLLLNAQLSVVYIDEPELHLNQQWHSTLLRAMQIVAPRVQFIVATHSPEIWNSVDVDQRFLLQEGRVYA